MGVDPSLVDMDYINEPMDMIDDIAPSMPTTSWNTVNFKGASVSIPRESMHYFGNGWYGNDEPPKATVEWGREMLQVMADYTADFVEEFEKIDLPQEK